MEGLAGPAGETPGMTTATVRMSREDASAAPTTNSFPAPEGPPSDGGQPAAPVDVGHLADRVYDVLVRRLSSEREQRGW
jgi:hypothetical protein